MIEVSVVEVVFRMLGPGEHMGYGLFLRRDGAPWEPDVPLAGLTVKTLEQNGVGWLTIGTMNWRKLREMVDAIGASTGRSDVHHTMLRAVPPTPVNGVNALINDSQPVGKACAHYVWTYTDIASAGNSKLKSVRIEVNERGGMVGGATFQGIAPYPVPGYDLAWTDDSPGG